jgi:hypothetical protein
MPAVVDRDRPERVLGRIGGAGHIGQDAERLVGAVAAQEGDVLLDGELAVDLVREPLLEVDRDVVEQPSA